MKRSCAAPEMCSCVHNEDLTSRETQVLMYLIDGLNNREIAEILIVSVNTIKAHVSNILSKLNVNSRVKAVRLGIVSN